MDGKRREWAANEAEWWSEGWERRRVCMRYRVQSSWWTTRSAHSADGSGSISIFAARSVQFPPGDFNLRVKELRLCDVWVLIKQKTALRGHTSHNVMDLFFPPFSSPRRRRCASLIKHADARASEHNKSRAHVSAVPPPGLWWVTRRTWTADRTVNNKGIN